MLTDLEMEPGAKVGADGQRTCLEVGCGSGAISLSLLNSMPQVRFVSYCGNEISGHFPPPKYHNNLCLN